MTLKAIDLKPRIGSRVEARVDDLLSGAHAREILELLEERVVLVFPRLNLTDEQHLTFSRTLGEVIPQCETGVRPISLDGPGADYIKTSFYWHFDGALDAVPSCVGLLSARRLSTTGGGQTELANTYAAYEDLPDDEKKAYDKLRVVHSFEANQRILDPVPQYMTLLDWRRRYPHPRLHPMVWHHKDGRNSLAIGTTACHVDGMSLDDSRLLLAKLLDWSTQPQYVYTHKWEVGDLAVYNNTAVLHRAIPYDLDSNRLMHRTALVGEQQAV